jgi:hypothetical protein
MIPVFFTKVRATGTRLTAGNGSGRNTNWSVVDEVSMLATVPILVLRLGENWTMLCKRDYARSKCELHNQF